MKCETQRQCGTIGNETRICARVAGERQTTERSGSNRGREYTQYSNVEVGSRTSATKDETGSAWSSAAFAGQADRALASRITARSLRLWIPERSLDIGSHNSCDLGPIRHSVYVERNLVGVAAHGLELPTGEASVQQARRGSHRPVVALRVATGKKSGVTLARSWFLRTKAVIPWCCPWRPVGPHAVKHPVFVPALTIINASMRSVRLFCRRSERWCVCIPPYVTEA